ncbi:MAG: hypothetical protein H7195_05630 [Chryseobacterium sp.]|nr:hypothetical protein [Chryseobacterium sp.]
MELNNNDKKRIWLELKISTIIPSILFALIVILLTVGIGITAFFTKVKPGFMNRTLTILMSLFIPFLYFVFLSAIKYIDLKRNTKIRIQVREYEIKKVKNNFYVVSKGDNFKVKIFEDLIPLIDISSPLIVEFTKYSKVLLFVSHDNLNLLDKIEKI